MSIPQMTRALVLEHPVRTADGACGFVTCWQALGVIWAAIRPGAGRETANLARQPYKITLRAAPYGAPSRPVPGQRFRQGDRIYRIESVAEADAKGLYLTCTATQEVAT